MDNIVIAKAAVIERCIKRIHEEYTGDPDELETNFTKQDSIILNLERLVQATIDMGAHVVKIKRLGYAERYRDIFDLLAKAEILPEGLALSLKKRVGFRNIAIHEYQAMDLDIVVSIIETQLSEIERYKTLLLQLK